MPSHEAYNSFRHRQQGAVHIILALPTVFSKLDANVSWRHCYRHSYSVMTNME